jgi:Fic family protein
MFKPRFQISPSLAQTLMKIESLKQAISSLPITPRILAGLHKSSRLQSAHYSTQIEGNRLTQEQVNEVIEQGKKIPSRERDTKEVLGYFSALEHLEKLVEMKSPFSEKALQSIHGLVMGGGKKKVAPTPYRDGQNVIKDGMTGAIVYLPPEAKDVPALMHDLIAWLKDPETEMLPCPLRAAIAHYQYATIHPYYDGNGRTARLFASWVLHACGYGLKGIYSLEEYYAHDLAGYYEALSAGPSHNYYFGRADADISGWLSYYCEGLAYSFEKIKEHTQKQLQKEGKTSQDASHILRTLDPRKRQALDLFVHQETITAKDIEHFFHISGRTARDWCQRWVEEGFLIIDDPSKKARRYRLSEKIGASFKL